MLYALKNLSAFSEQFFIENRMEIKRGLRSNTAVWMKLVMMAKLMIKSCDTPSSGRQTIRDQRRFRTGMLLKMSDKGTESGMLRTETKIKKYR